MDSVSKIECMTKWWCEPFKIEIILRCIVLVKHLECNFGISRYEPVLYSKWSNWIGSYIQYYSIYKLLESENIIGQLSRTQQRSKRS